MVTMTRFGVALLLVVMTLGCYEPDPARVHPDKAIKRTLILRDAFGECWELVASGGEYGSGFNAHHLKANECTRSVER